MLTFFSPLPEVVATPSNDRVVPSALVSSASSPSRLLPHAVGWVANRIAQSGLTHGPVAKYFESLAIENKPRAKANLVEADPTDDDPGHDNELLDSLLVK